MGLGDYLKHLKVNGPGAVDDFAGRCNTSAAYLRQVALGHRRANGGLAITIERESKGVVTCESIRPDYDWQYIRGTAKSAA